VASSFDQLIALRATDGISPAVDIRLPLIQVGNRERQQHVSEMLESLGSWERLSALPSAVQEIPNEPGLYMFVWCPPLRLRFEDPIQVCEARATNEYFVTHYVIYVGQAGGGGGGGSLRARFRTEYSRILDKRSPEELFSRSQPKGRRERLERYLSLEPLEYWFMVTQDTSHLKVLERSLQELLNPPGIAQNRASLYKAETRKAFQ
jgi:hypothetical protein